jgi:phosphoglucosamine mutase
MSHVAFGTDGVRGRAGEWPVVPEVARRIGVVVGRRAGPGGRVVVGGDPRPSSPALEVAVAEGVAASGATVVRAGVVPTAALQVALADGRAALGVMITASHNPAADNGFKVLLAGGRKPDDAAAAALEAEIAAQVDPGPGGALPPSDPAVAEAWLGRIAAACRGASGLLAGRRLVVDLANGALAPHRAALEGLLPGGVVWLGDGSGPINDACGSEHLETLQAAVRAAGADAGLAVDGDADRIRLVDEAGAEVAGDAITWLLARRTRVTALAVTVMSTTALELALPGVRIVRTPVGDRHLREAMDREDLALGAEDSGHVLFADHPGGDGLFAAIRALQAAFAVAPRLSDAVKPFRPFPRRLTKVVVTRRSPVSEVPTVADAVRNGERALGAGGRVFVRYSGTEPVLRILVEGRSPDVVERVSAEVTAAARGALA